jgi:hypothetical protein
MRHSLVNIYVIAISEPVAGAGHTHLGTRGMMWKCYTKEATG